MDKTTEGASPSPVQNIFRWLLGAALIFSGTGHLTFARKDFQAQVPRFLPLPPDLTVVLSGLVEIALGGALILLKRYRTTIGRIVAVFFVAIFPGNVSQYLNHRSAFGLNSDTKRLVRLLGQPVLVAWTLWSTEAWKTPSSDQPSNNK